MKPRMVVLLSLLFIVVSLVAIVGYYWVSQSAKVDASWIATIDEMLENARIIAIKIWFSVLKHFVNCSNP